MAKRIVHIVTMHIDADSKGGREFGHNLKLKTKQVEYIYYVDDPEPKPEHGQGPPPSSHPQAPPPPRQNHAVLPPLVAPRPAFANRLRIAAREIATRSVRTLAQAAAFATAIVATILPQIVGARADQSTQFPSVQTAVTAQVAAQPLPVAANAARDAPQLAAIRTAAVAIAQAVTARLALAAPAIQTTAVAQPALAVNALPVTAGVTAAQAHTAARSLLQAQPVVPLAALPAPGLAQNSAVPVNATPGIVPAVSRQTASALPQLSPSAIPAARSDAVVRSLADYRASRLAVPHLARLAPALALKADARLSAPAQEIILPSRAPSRRAALAPMKAMVLLSAPSFRAPVIRLPQNDTKQLALPPPSERPMANLTLASLKSMSLANLQQPPTLPSRPAGRARASIGAPAPSPGGGGRGGGSAAGGGGGSGGGGGGGGGGR